LRDFKGLFSFKGRLLSTLHDLLEELLGLVDVEVSVLHGAIEHQLVDLVVGEGQRLLLHQRLDRLTELNFLRFLLAVIQALQLLLVNEHIRKLISLLHNRRHVQGVYHPLLVLPILDDQHLQSIG